MLFIPHRHLTGLIISAILGWLCLILAPGAQGQPPQTPTQTRLSDWWLDQPALPPQPGYAYFLRQEHREPQRHQAVRLEEELRTATDRLTILGQHTTASGVSAWRQALEDQQSTQGRTPARADLTALLASPRHDPRLTSLAAAGQCDMPDWVELWSFDGVSRHTWTPGMSLQRLLRDQPGDHWHPAEAAWVVTPQSAPRRIGTSAWNAGDTPLVPGTRVTLELPIDDTAAGWVNQALPAYLSTRLPGDSCIALPLPGHSQPSAADTSGGGQVATSS